MTSSTADYPLLYCAMITEFKPAGRFWRPLLRLLGCAAIAMPWRTVYMMPEYFHHALLRQHELVHIAQMERHGTLRFCVLYLWWTLRHGYWDNPFEIEAYRIAPTASRE